MVEVPKPSVPKLEETVLRLRQSLAAAEANLYGEYARVAETIGMGKILQEVFGTRAPLEASGTRYQVQYGGVEHKEMQAMRDNAASAVRQGKFDADFKTDRYSVVVGYGEESTACARIFLATALKATLRWICARLVFSIK
jgi:hypothetical protein